MLKEKCQQLRDSPTFEIFIIGVIMFAGILVGIETSESILQRFRPIFTLLDKTILAIFVVEILVKMGAEGKRPWRYFLNAWNVFDFLIVAVCFIPFVGSWVAIVRLARILRALRLVTAVPKLQILVGALLSSIPSMFYVSILLALHFYVYAVMGTLFFRENDPGHFGHLGLASLTLFRVVTLEDWTDVMYTAVYGSDIYPAQGAIPVGPDPHSFGLWAVLYFVTFVIIGAMVMINLFIGVILTSITEAQAEQLRNKMHLHSNEEEQELLEKIQNLESQVQSIRTTLQKKWSKRHNATYLKELD